MKRNPIIHYNAPTETELRQFRGNCVTTPTQLYERWRAGDEEAARQLFALYSQQLCNLAQSHISDRLARRIDGEDVVQSVFRTFFRRSAESKFNVNSAVDIWRLLVKITILKARTEARHHTAAKRDIAAESPDTAPDWMLESMGSEPTPADAVELVDLIETAMRGLPPTHHQVLALRLAGCSSTEIASELKISRQTVYRILSILCDRIQQSLGPPER